MGMIDKLSYQLLKKNEYIGDFNEEYQIGEKPIGLKKKLIGAAYMLTHLYHPKYRSEIFHPQAIKAYDFDAMKKKIDDVDVVSFDIFDTLLLRPVYQPRDMFYFLEKDNRVIDFRKKRARAEEWARNHTDKKNREINIFDIYNCLHSWCGLEPKNAALAEVETEKKLCFAHPYVRKLYQYALDNHKTLIATSDMYIPKEYMKEILTDNGYDDFNDIFVSCDYEKSKHTGELYELVKKKYSGKTILHIGDNRYSDIIVAKKYGLSTIHIQNVNRTGEKYRRFQHQSFMCSVYSGLVDAYLYSGIHEWVEKCHNVHFLYGFLCGGPLTYGLCQWLDDLALKKNADKILFLARDGFIFSEVYTKYFNHVNSEYVHASRMALYPVLCKLDYDMYLQEAFYKRIVYAKIKPIDALKDIGVYSYFNADLQAETKEKFHEEQTDWISFKEWMLDKKEVLNDIYQEQLQAIDFYFKQVIGNNHNIIIFDLGWRGTSILYLKKYLEMKFEGLKITGAMLGTQEMPMTELYVLDETIENYVFSEMNPSIFSRINGQKMMYLNERFALEYIFTSAEPSLIKYEANGHEISFVYEKGGTNCNAGMVNNMHLGINEFIKMYRDKWTGEVQVMEFPCQLACLPMWQVLSMGKVMQLFQQYEEADTTLHGYGCQKE